MAQGRQSGGYRTLSAFQFTTVIYDATVAFCERFVDPKSRLVDQMVQAARSGRQNIAEGARAGVLSPDTERRLKNVARASLEELLLDYEDYLRQRGLGQWKTNQTEAVAVLQVWRTRSEEPEAIDAIAARDWRRLDDLHRVWYAAWLGKGISASVQANALICLINQANYRLDKDIQGLGLAKNSDANVPPCPICGEPMILRTRKSGRRPGEAFWGCSHYPDCRGTRSGSEGRGGVAR